MKNNIGLLQKEDCTGCRGCEAVCPVNCILMEADEEGFLYPIIDEKRCVECGRCFAVCGIKAAKHQEDAKREAYAAANHDADILNKSSSGGVFYELAQHTLRRGGTVYGAAFAKDFSVEQRRIDRMDDIPLLMGAKYVQSDTKATFRQVKDDLAAGRAVLYTGVPCQTTALQRYIGEDGANLSCVAVICQGAPSPEVWRRYLALKMGQYGEYTVRAVHFRDKTYGWARSGLKIDFGGREAFIGFFGQEPYTRGFLQNLYLRPSCHACRAKQEAIYADIVIGDYWGIGEEIPEMDYYGGVSCVIINSDKGSQLWEGVKDKFRYAGSSYDAVLKHNRSIAEGFAEHRKRKAFFDNLREGGVLEEALAANLDNNPTPLAERQRTQYPILYEYLKRQVSDRPVLSTIRRLGLRRVALYALTDMTQLVLEDMRSAGDEFTVYAACRNEWRFEKTGWQGLKVLSASELCRMEDAGKLDGVIVCNPPKENCIISDLTKAGFPIKKVYTIGALVFD